MGAALWLMVPGVVLAARLDPSFAPIARWTALGGAFWMAVIVYLRRGGRTESGSRFVAGLALAGAFAHLGWAILHLDEVMAHPRVLLNPAVGHSVLFAPLGILALSPGKRAARERYLAAALGSLPEAFAVARLGCLACGCCQGSSAVFGADATPLCEIAGLLALASWTQRLPTVWVGPVTLSGFGTIRLLTEPFRTPPQLGEPLIAPAVLGIGWIVAGPVMALAALQRPRRVLGLG
jgi:hypothetical protein